MAIPRVAVVIVSFNTRELTLRAVESVRSSSGVDVSIWVVDNASADGSAEAIRERFPYVRLIESKRNLGFGRANNAALEHIDTPYVLFLNPDAALPEESALARMVASLEGRPRTGVLGPELRASDGRPWHSVHPFPSIPQYLLRGVGLHRGFSSSLLDKWLANEFHDHTKPGPVDWLTGACLLTRGEVLRAVGGFDPALFLYGEDLDWCWRVQRAGWEVMFDPSVVVVHEGSASSGDLSAWRIRIAFAGTAYVVRKHRGGAYFAVFAVMKSLGLALGWVLQGAVGVLTGSEARKAHARRSSDALRHWLFVVRQGAARDPGSEAFLRRVGVPAA